jgi:hypothetical protein
LTRTIQLVLLHAAVGAFAALTFWSMRGNLLERMYDARMKWRFARLLMPCALRNREVWIKQQKLIFCFGVVLALLVYGFALAKILCS